MLDLSPETEALVRAKAEAAGKTPDQVIWEAFAPPGVSLKLQRARRTKKDMTKEEFFALAEEFSARCAALPVLDDRSADEIIGYDEFGVPR